MFLQSILETFQELYLLHPTYLITNLIFTFLLHIFVSVILLVLSENKSNKEYKPKKENVLIQEPIYFVTHVFRFISKLHLLVLLRYRHLRQDSKNSLDSEYILFNLIVGFIMACILLILAEFSYNLSLVLYVVWSVLLLLYIVGLGQIRRLHRKLESKYQTRHADGMIYFRCNTVEKYLEGRMSLLGISLHAGMIGIITTIGAGILEVPLSFALVPTTFDMISVTSALLEFPGLRIILPTIEDLKKLKKSILAIIVSIALSIFITITTWRLGLIPITSFSNTIVSIVWALIAILVSILTYKPVKN